MRVVADASPLRYLILIGQVDLLQTLFTSITVPRAVLGELQRRQTPAVVRRWMQQLPAWCIVRTPQQPLATVLDVLGAGERAALALAQELHADVVLIDEDKGRQIARSLGFRVTGTLGVLDTAAARGLIDLPAVLTQLQATDFYVSPDLIAELLTQDAARKRQASGPDHP
jgi:predicted nucleic acid-binding protein